MSDKKEFSINFTNRNENSVMYNVTSIEGFANSGKTLGLMMTMLSEDLGGGKYDYAVFVVTEETAQHIVHRAKKLCGASDEVLENVTILDARDDTAPAVLDEMLHKLTSQGVNYCCYIDNIEEFTHLNKHISRAANGDTKKACGYVVKEISNYGPLVFTKNVNRTQSMEWIEAPTSKPFTSPITPPPKHRYTCTINRDSGKLILNPIANT